MIQSRSLDLIAELLAECRHEVFDLIAFGPVALGSHAIVGHLTFHLLADDLVIHGIVRNGLLRGFPPGGERVMWCRLRSSFGSASVRDGSGSGPVTYAR